MRKIFYLVTFLQFAVNTSVHMETYSNFVLVIHGGAGTFFQKYLTAEKKAAYRQKLEEALIAGYAIVKANGSSVEAVQEAINVMEDLPLFNAGKGAVYTNAETQEIVASIMNGNNKSTGIVAGVGWIKNPIDVAIAVMNKSEYVLFC